MSFKKVVTEVVDRIDITVGRGFAFLDAHTSFVIGLEGDLLKALENPAVPAVLSSILPSQIVAQIPAIETILQKAIADEIAGTQIENDVNAASGTEAKLRVLIADIQKTPGINKGIIRDICVSVLAALNNNALPTEVYGLYLYAKKLMG